MRCWPSVAYCEPHFWGGPSLIVNTVPSPRSFRWRANLFDVAKFLGKTNSDERDRFRPKIVEIGAILAIFEPFEVLKIHMPLFGEFRRSSRDLLYTRLNKFRGTTPPGPRNIFINNIIYQKVFAGFSRQKSYNTGRKSICTFAFSWKGQVPPSWVKFFFGLGRGRKHKRWCFSAVKHRTDLKIAS